MILAIITGAMTKEQYDKIRGLINLENDSPKGLHVHASDLQVNPK